jgi:methylamine dehydrogenase heavy chain
LLLGILGCGAALAQEPIAPEELTVEQSIAPGPNVYAVTPNWGGVGAVYIFSAEDLSFKGAMTTGLVAQFTMAGGVGYATSAFPRRIISGPVEAVLQSFSFPDLAMTREIIIPSTMAQTAAFQGALQVSADGAFAFVQNATPATSVTIVNLRTGEVAGEAPTPGCWAINLAPSGRKFTMLCGDGTLLSVKIDETGAPAGQFHSAQIFDAQADP